ncbi:TIM barrel protein [Furfurilactobacillus milii]|uniref:TIM barrel protein n=1 Tax=Furfurilactobacillus milii TaxID=2888272 RepID=A0A6N9I3J1_9LACO|nr:TIM barrel protein [Furfurilactobacillus milii]MYV17530.1 TIM barrel protein [Furfurilactobacillus milii]
MISKKRIGINRNVAPGMSLEKFAQLAKDNNIKIVELRNDLSGVPTVESITDGRSIEEVKSVLKGLKIETINALGNADSAELLQNNVDILTQMCEVAKQLSVTRIIFCPTRDASDTRSDGQRQEDLVTALRSFSAILKSFGLQGLLEPLGFADSVLQTPWEAQAALKISGVDNFKIVADTFHYFLAGVTARDIQKRVDVKQIGLVHMSTVAPGKSVSSLADEDRMMLDNADESRCLEYVRLLQASGYSGNYSFEPFSSKLRQWDLNRASESIAVSVQMVEETAKKSSLEL